MSFEMRWFVLNPDNSLSEVDLDYYCKHPSTKDERKIVRSDETPTGKIVTAFFGMDHRIMASGTCPMDDQDSDNLPEDLPIVFGTMIFGGEKDSHEWMWSTYDKAIAGHERELAKISQ